jgi:hypothetical protein
MARVVETVALADFAADHGVTVRTVTNWIAAGMPHRTTRGERRVVRAEANRWLKADIHAKARAEVAPSEADERARKLRFEADLKELELQERRAFLVPAEKYREHTESFVGGFAAVAAGQLARFEREIVVADDAPKARKVTQAIHEALMRGSQEYADQLEAERVALIDAESEAA